MFGSLIRTAVLSAVVVCATALPASAADRYAAPGGPESPTAACSPVTPCGIATAINEAADGDTIHVASGVYGSPAAPITTSLGQMKSGLKIKGASVFDKPLLHLAGNGSQVPLDLQGDGSLLEDVRIEGYGTLPTLHAWGGVVSRVEISTSTASYAALSGNRFYNSVLVNRRPVGGVALSVHSGLTAATEPGPIEEVELRGLTLWAVGEGSRGLSTGSTGGLRRVLRLQNSIVHGAQADIQASADAVHESRAYVVAENSSYQTIDQVSNDSYVTPPGSGTNTTADPLFANFAAGDLRQAFGSPMIDAGADGPVVEAVDAAGNARIQGARVDIGAYEATVTTVLSALKAGTTKFLVSSRGAALRPATARPKARRGKKRVGSLVSFQLSQADQVTLRLERARSGRRSGSNCVKETRKNHKAKRCTYYSKLKGSESFSGVAGNNVLWFTGRWGGKKLATNTRGFRITAAPTISGLGGPPATSATRVLKPVAR